MGVRGGREEEEEEVEDDDDEKCEVGDIGGSEDSGKERKKWLLRWNSR